MKKILSCAAALLLGACASGGLDSRTMTAAQPTNAMPAPNPRDVGGKIQDVYFVGPADKLNVYVTDLPDMTQNVMVDPAGYISLPIVGPVKAGGRTTEEIRAEIAERLGRTVLVRPSVSVAIADTTSQRITIDGAVARPGVFPVTGSTTLMRAIPLASGPSELADERQVVVYRTVDGQRMVALYDLKKIRAGQLDDPEIYGNDIIIVGASRYRQVLRDIGTLFPILGAYYTIDRIAGR